MSSNIEEAKAKEIRREYMRKWRAEHPDQVKKHTQDYWIRQARKLIEEETAAEQGRAKE